MHQKKPFDIKSPLKILECDPFSLYLCPSLQSTEQVTAFCRSLHDMNPLECPMSSSSSSSSSSLSPSPVSALPPTAAAATQRQLSHADKLRKVINELVETEKTYVKVSTNSPAVSWFVSDDPYRTDWHVVSHRNLYLSMDYYIIKTFLVKLHSVRIVKVCQVLFKFIAVIGDSFADIKNLSIDATLNNLRINTHTCHSSFYRKYLITGWSCSCFFHVHVPFSGPELPNRVLPDAFAERELPITGWGTFYLICVTHEYKKWIWIPLDIDDINLDSHLIQRM